MDNSIGGHHTDDLASLFDKLTSLPVTRRQAFIEEVSRGRPQLRDQLNRLLEASEQPWPESLGEILGDPGALMPEEGSRIGDYLIEELVDIGGFGEVYRASRADGLFEREVAIKVLNGIDGVDELGQFRSEARILASLNHPNVAQLLDANVTSSGRPYIILEYVRGLPIDCFCADAGLGLRKRLHLFLELCEAVQFAHRNLIVHGDLTPGNVLVNEEGRVKLLDFGISRLSGGEPQKSKILGGGTPGFAAPEQLQGGHLTTASDVYSLGRLLAHLLADPKPHEPRVLWPSRGSRQSHRCVGASPENGVQIGTVSAAVRNPDVASIITEATRLDPNDRYGSVRALAEDVENVLAWRPVKAREPGFLGRISRFLRRNARSSALVLVIALSLFAGTAVSLWQAGLARSQRDLARAEAEKARRLYNVLLALFDEADPQARTAATLTVRDVLDVGVKNADSELADQPVLHASLLTSIGRIYRNLGIYDRATELLASALRLQAEAGLGTGPDVAETVLETANIDYYTGKYPESEALFQRALRMLEREFGADSLEVANARMGFAELLVATGRFVEAVEHLQTALDIRLQKLGGGLAVANSYAGLAKAFHCKGDFERAEEFYLKAQRAFESSDTQDHATAGDNLNNLGLLMKLQGRYEEAEEYYSRALKVLEKAYGKGNVRTAACLLNIGQLYKSRGDLDRAEEFVRRSVEIDRRGLGPFHPSLATSLNNLGVLLKERGKYDEAERLYTESLDIRRKILPANHSDIGQSVNNLAALSYLRKDFDEALSRFKQALEISRQAYGGDHPQVASIVNNIGVVQEKRGALGEALKAYQEALAILEPLTSPGQEKRLVIIDNLARVLLIQRKFAQAKPYLESLVEGRRRLYGSDHAKTKQAEKSLRACLRELS